VPIFFGVLKMRKLIFIAIFVLSAISLVVTDEGASQEYQSPVSKHVEEELIDNEIDDTPNEIGGDEHDPCEGKRCGPGKECKPMENGKAKCICIEKCPDEEDNRRRVCSNYNETWNSDCELYRARCHCLQKNSDKCLDPATNSHLHIDYYGECRDMPICTPEEMDDFPRRMRDWLFNVMREMADRRELSDYYMRLERDAEKMTDDLNRKAGVAAVWKFCDLDHTHDSVVSRHELFPIRAPLLALEHCISPFLDGCDADEDHRVTLEEWANCLQISAGEMNLKCDDIRDIDMGEDIDEDDEDPEPQAS